jgi:hypothetical protein
MARVCTACTHEHRPEIDRMLAAGIGSQRSVAKKFGLSDAAVCRHKAHVTARMARAVEAAEARQDQKLALIDRLQSADLVERLRAINSATLGILAEARRAGRLSVAVSAIGRLVDLAEVEAKILGAIEERRVNVNVLQIDPATAEKMARLYLERRALPAAGKGDGSDGNT